MLTFNKHDRISAKEALSDPWIQKYAPHHPINKRALQNLSTFQVYDDLISFRLKVSFEQH